MLERAHSVKDDPSSYMPSTKGVGELEYERLEVSRRSTVENGVHPRWLNHRAGDTVSLRIRLTRLLKNDSASWMLNKPRLDARALSFPTR